MTTMSNMTFCADKKEVKVLTRKDNKPIERFVMRTETYTHPNGTVDVIQTRQTIDKDKNYIYTEADIWLVEQLEKLNSKFDKAKVLLNESRS